MPTAKKPAAKKSSVTSAKKAASKKPTTNKKAVVAKKKAAAQPQGGKGGGARGVVDREQMKSERMANAAAAREKILSAIKNRKSSEQRPWSVLHIFGNGESQVNGSEINGKVESSELKSLAGLYSALAKKQRKGVKITPENTQAIILFNGRMAEFRSRGGVETWQRFEWADVDARAATKVAEEIKKKADAAAERRRAERTARLADEMAGVKPGKKTASKK